MQFRRQFPLFGLTLVVGVVVLLALSISLPPATPSAALPARGPKLAAAASPAWEQLFPGTGSPPVRQFATMAFDPKLGELVLFGGLGAGGQPLNDTWVFNETGWYQLPLTTAPAPRSNVGLVYDPTLQGLLLFGGNGGSGSFGDTWVFNASGWHELFPVHSPPAWESSQLVYDATDGYALFAYASLGAPRIDNVWTFNGTDWSNITSSVGVTPPNVWLDSSENPSGGNVVFYGGSFGCGNPAWGTDLTWTFSHGTYTNVTAAQSIAPANQLPALSMAYDPVLGGVVMFSGYTIGCVATNTTYLFQSGHWTDLTSVVGPSPPPRWNARLAYLPGVGDVLYSGNEAPMGGYDVLRPDAWVLTTTPLAIGQFTVAPDMVAVNQPFTFYANASGGVEPYAYIYQDLPPGCATSGGSTLTCQTATPGNYTVEVQVVDSLGVSVSAFTHLEVSAHVTLPPSSSGGSSTSVLPVVGAVAAIGVGLALLAVSLWRRLRASP